MAYISGVRSLAQNPCQLSAIYRRESTEFWETSLASAERSPARLREVGKLAEKMELDQAQVMATEGNQFTAGRFVTFCR